MRSANLISLVLTLLALSSGGTLTASAAQQADEAALLTAVREGRVDDVRTLLDRGIDVNARNEDGWTPLLFAAVRGHAEVVALLLERGADMNASNDDGWTALMRAAFDGHAEMVNLLLEHGADVDAKGKDKWTPLMSAALGGHTEVVTLLVEHGADVNAKEKEGGLTPLMFAAVGGHADVVNLLLERGADVDAQGKEGGTALTAATAAGHNELVRLLLDHVADVKGAFSTPFTVGPEFRDPSEAVETLMRYYSRNLQNAGIGGRVSIWILVGTDGRVLNAQVGESSGHQALDLAALRAARKFEFTPARINYEPVPVWINFPVAFAVTRTVEVVIWN